LYAFLLYRRAPNCNCCRSTAAALASFPSPDPPPSPRCGVFFCYAFFGLQAAERKERKENKNSKRMGEDGIADDDLQVVSGERELENLAPKERAKLEKKRGLIRAGMGAAADDVEDTGKRYKPKFAVDGLEVMDDREYGSDEVWLFSWQIFACARILVPSTNTLGERAYPSLGLFGFAPRNTLRAALALSLNISTREGLACAFLMPVISRQDDEYESGRAMRARARRFVGPLPALIRDL